MKREHGFTLVELLATLALVSVLLTLGVTALRYFWLGQTLTRERDQIFSNLRGIQQQVVSESNPFVFGAWLKESTPTTDDGSDQWGTFRYSPGSPATCTSTGLHRMGGGVHVTSASFDDTLATGAVGPMETACLDQIPAAAGADEFIFFLARGMATSGCVTLRQHNRDMDDVAVAVSALTGRVERLSGDEAAADARCV